MKPEQGPPRLREDAAFRAETGCDLGAEAHALEAPHLPALRARVLAQPTQGGSAAKGARVKVAAVGLTVTALLVTLAFFHVFSASVVRPAPAPPEPAPATAPSPPSPAPLAPAPAATAPAPARRVAPIPRAETPSPPETAPVPVAPSLPAAELPAPEPDPAVEATLTTRSGDLAAQDAAFATAEEHLAAGDAASALDAYRAYLTRWPAGTFRAEALVGELHALIRLGNAAEVTTLAATLAEEPALASRRPEILAAWADALVQLGRCDEARALATGLPRGARGRIARACR